MTGMTRRFGTVIAMSLLLLAALATPRAALATPQDVSILATKTLGETVPGTFVASGAINDAGAFVQSAFLAAAVPSPVVGSEHYTVTFTSARGTITVDVQTLLTFSSPGPVLVEDGPWLVTNGTGSYAGYLGQGKLHKVIDVPKNLVTFTFQGQVHSKP